MIEFRLICPLSCPIISPSQHIALIIGSVICWADKHSFAILSLFQSFTPKHLGCTFLIIKHFRLRRYPTQFFNLDMLLWKNYIDLVPKLRNTLNLCLFLFLYLLQLQPGFHSYTKGAFNGDPLQLTLNQSFSVIRLS